LSDDARRLMDAGIRTNLQLDALTVPLPRTADVNA